MLKHKKLIIIIVSIIFFITAVTIYVNRVLFPQMVKKIAIEQAENFLKRKVEIESIRFNWVKGFMIDKIKVYQKDSTTDVFLQAQGLSFGVIIIPGLKQHKITIPFITVYNPAGQLIRVSDTQWNFSDVLTGLEANKTDEGKPSPFTVALGAINVENGQLRVDDLSQKTPWTETFDQINLHMTLSYKGINYDFKADIPKRQGSLAAKGTFGPISHDLQSQIHLKNIDTAPYLSFVALKDINIKSTFIKEITLDITYNKEKTTAQGEIAVDNIDISINGIGLKSNVKATISKFLMEKDILSFEGAMNLKATEALISSNQRINGEFNLENIKVRKDKDGTQGVGTLTALGLKAQWLNQEISGDFTLKPFTLLMKDEKHIEASGSLKAENILASIDKDTTFSGNLNAQDIQLSLINTQDLTLSTKLNIDGMKLSLGAIKAQADIKANKLLVKMADDTLKLSTLAQVDKALVDLGDKKIIQANPQLELNLTFPLKSPENLKYDGSVTANEIKLEGFPYVELIKNIEIDADFKNDELTLNAISIKALDTDLRATGLVKDFKAPWLNITAEANDLNLERLKEVIPDLIKTYGLDLSGSSSLKVKFEGEALKPLEGKILAVSSLKKVNVASSTFKQTVNNITGVVEATPDSLKWRDFTATYLESQYTLTGGLTDFKNPKITTSLDGKDVSLKADIIKEGDLVTINDLTGKYLNLVFGVTGTTLLAQGQEPQLDLKSKLSFRIEDMLAFLPAEQQKTITPLKPSGMISLEAALKGTPQDWQNWNLTATATSNLVSVMDYKLNDLKVNLTQSQQRIKNLTVDGILYDGKLHAVASADLSDKAMPFDLALNIDDLDMKKIKMDSPFKAEEINGKFYLTTIAEGTIADIKNLNAKGSFAVREGFLAEFALFKGLLGVLNEALRLGQVMITDVEANFTIADQKINTDNLRLRSPTIVLLGEGWMNFDQICDLTMTVDLSSGIVPPIAEDVLRSLEVRVYDKISNPKFTKKISVPQVINTILKTIF